MHKNCDCMTCMRSIIQPIELERLKKYTKNKPQEEKKGLDEFFWK